LLSNFKFPVSPHSPCIPHAAELDASYVESRGYVAQKSGINDRWNLETLVVSDPDVYIARHDYCTEQAGQLSIMKGDCFTISRKSVDGDWSEATNQQGKMGWVPSSYIGKLNTLEKLPWFHGNITRAEAELCLKNGMNGSFLVRESESTYSISLCCDGRVFHYVIIQSGSSPSSKFYQKPFDYAMWKYAYYVCYKCKKVRLCSGDIIVVLCDVDVNCNNKLNIGEVKSIFSTQHQHTPPTHYPHTTHTPLTYHPHTRLVQSEYDEYREKYHFFDSALFCMPPEHKLRTICRTILTAQMDPPKQKHSDTHPDQLKKIVKNLITFVIR